MDAIEKTKKEKRQEIQDINRKNGVDIKLLVKTRIRSQLSYEEAAELAEVNEEEYRNWEYNEKTVPVTTYCILLARFGEAITNQKCRNCYYYNGEPGDGVEFCDRKEEDVPETGHCQYWLRRDAHQ